MILNTEVLDGTLTIKNQLAGFFDGLFLLE